MKALADFFFWDINRNMESGLKNWPYFELRDMTDKCGVLFEAIITFQNHVKSEKLPTFCFLRSKKKLILTFIYS